MRFIRHVLLAGILLWANVATAAVAKDASMTAGNSADGFNQEVSAATSISSTGITVGASATCLVGMITFASSSGTAPTAIAMTWGGTSMTAGPEARHVSVAYAVSKIFWLTNPASGALTLQATWTSANDAYMSAISFTGADTTNCVNAADNITATATTSLTVTSTTDGATVANFAVNGAAPTVNFTQIWSEAPLTPGGGGNFTLGGTSNTHTFTGAGGTRQAIAGVHVVVAAGGAAPPSNLPTMGCCGKAALTIGNPAAVGGYSNYGFDFLLTPDLISLVNYPACDAAADCKAGVRICQAGTTTKCADFFAGDGQADMYLLRKQGTAAAQAFKAGVISYSGLAVFGAIP